MTAWNDLRSGIRDVIFLLATSAATLGPASDAHARVGVGDNSASTSSEVPLRASLVGDAKVELERATRVLAEFERDESVELRRYVEALERTVMRATKQPLHSEEAVAGLLTSLREARICLAGDIDNVRDWRRIALAVNPDLEVIQIPQRFVRRSNHESVLMEPWSPEERRVWMGELDM